MQFIDLAAQYQASKEKIDERIRRVLDHGQYIMGPEVRELESNLENYVGVKHAITCANGTDALTLALMALDVQIGEAVFCPTFTFFATAEAIAFQKATPVFVDSDSDTFNICPDALEHCIKQVISDGVLTPKAIIAVDLFGLPADYVRIQDIANKYDLKVIEDAAQGLGGNIYGKKAGSFGDIATTSFFPAKPLGCYGDGGAVFTDNDELADTIRSLRVHGKGANKYDNVRVGMNSRLDTLQAAILLEKLMIFPDELVKRNLAADSYEADLGDLYKTPVVPSGYYSSWAQYTLQVKDRHAEIQKFKERGIPTAIYYQTCMHQQSAFKHLNYSDQDFPVASHLANHVLSLPMHPYL